MNAPNASDRKSIRAAEKAALLRDVQRREVIGEIMSTTYGRAWLWDTLATCSIFHTTFNGDALASAFQEGRRSVGLALLADILAHCPDQYITAMREHNERNQQPDTDPANASTASERRVGPIPNRGDSGTLADQAPDSDFIVDYDIDGQPIVQHHPTPGFDIYTEGPKGT